MDVFYIRLIFTDDLKAYGLDPWWWKNRMAPEALDAGQKSRSENLHRNDDLKKVSITCLQNQ